MSRSRRTSPFEDLAEIAARCPWWVGIGLAAISYGVLHYFAVQEIAKPKTIHDIWGPIGRTIASIGQYVVPIALLIGAGISAFHQWRRRALTFRAQSDESLDGLLAMSWQDFEALVAGAFANKGYAVALKGGGAADGGIDIVLRKGGEKALVQCKQWRATKVPVQTVRELYGVMAAEGASHGFVVTSGQFTADARDFAQGRNIELLDGKHLRAMLGENKPRSIRPEAETSTSPSCPKCAGSMMKRMALRGANAGKAFWGCMAYPKCIGTRPI